jgi:hypothetical protein
VLQASVVMKCVLEDAEVEGLSNGDEALSRVGRSGRAGSASGTAATAAILAASSSTPSD